jgi:hypothetical protein
MKRSFSFILLLLVAGSFFASCRRNDNDKILHVLSVECESPVAQCGNGPAIRFNGEKFGIWMEPSGKPGNFVRVPYHYTVCCEYMPALIDTLKKAQALRLKSIEEKPEETDKTYVLLNGTRVRIFYKKHFIDDKEFSTIWFGEGTEGKVFYINLKEFDELIENIEKRFKTCCLE